jgi:hypothetical protein
LEYVLEAAVIHFDDETPPYHLTVEMIAAYLGKSPGQVSPALYRLVDDGFLLCDRSVCSGKPFRARAVVYPTQRALRTLPEYSNYEDEMMAAELAKLGSASRHWPLRREIFITASLSRTKRH